MDEHLSEDDLMKLIQQLGVRKKQYQEALDVVKQNPKYETLKQFLMYILLDAISHVDDPFSLGEGHTDALISVIDMVPEEVTEFPTGFFEAFYPHKLPAMFEIVTKAKCLDQNTFMQTMFSCLNRHLLLLLLPFKEGSQSFSIVSRVQVDKHQHVCPCNEQEICVSLDFASFVLSACTPLSSASPSAREFALFRGAILYNLLEEATLLYETGAVSNGELASLVQGGVLLEIQEMLEKGKNIPMAKFLRSVFHQPRSLLSAASLEVSRLLGHDVRGRKDRAQSLGLPHTLYDEVLFIRQVSDYRHAVRLRGERELVSVKLETQRILSVLRKSLLYSDD